MRKHLPNQWWIVALGMSAASPAWAVGQAEITPLVGMGELSGPNTDNYDPGLVVGLSLGARVSELLSLQAHGEYDRLNVDTSFRAIDSAYIARMLFSPAFHLVRDKLDFSIGPTGGLWWYRGRVERLGQEGRLNERGAELGVRASMMIAASPEVSIGPTFGYSRMWANKACLQINNTAELCNDDPDNDNDVGFWSLAFAARF